MLGYLGTLNQLKTSNQIFFLKEEQIKFLIMSLDDLQNVYAKLSKFFIVFKLYLMIYDNIFLNSFLFKMGCTVCHALIPQFCNYPCATYLESALL